MDRLNLPELQKELQLFLEELLSEKQYYQTDILELLNIPQQYISCYNNICEY